MFKALDYVNYDSLQLNTKQPPLPDESSLKTAATLQEMCCKVLNSAASVPDVHEYYHPSMWNHGGYLVNKDLEFLLEAVQILPSHVLSTLFCVAVDKSQTSAISHIISVWPLPTFCLRELLPPSQYPDLFQDELGFDLLIFRGLLRRRECCKMTCLDLRGFKLNRVFSSLIIQLWPLISLPKRTLADVKRLTQIVLKKAGLGLSLSPLGFSSPQPPFDSAIRSDTDLDPSVHLAGHLKEMLEQKVSTLMNRCKDFHIRIEKGQQLVVKVDSVMFIPTDSLCQDYLIAHCLQDVTPIRVQVSQIFFRSSIYHVQTDNDFLLSPYTVLHGHDTQFLEGVSLRQLEDGVFKMIAPVLYKFQNLQAIELQDCNIYLQNGRTRSKTEDRKVLCTFLYNFPLLVRLDLSFNYLVGCLGEVLEAVHKPLQYLGLRGCDLDCSDLDALARSKHAASLRELNISKISFCLKEQYYIGEQYSTSMEVVTALRSFPHLNILNMSQASLVDSQLDQLCDVFRNNLRELKMLDLSAVVMSPEYQVEVCLACASIPSFQKVSLTLVTSLVEELNQWNGTQSAFQTIKSKLNDTGRSDIFVDPVLFSRAIFLDIVDDMQF